MFRAIALLSVSVSLAAASDVTGAWKLTAKAPDGRSQTVDLSFERAEGKLTGTIGQNGASTALREVKQEGASLSFQAQEGEIAYSFQLTLSGDTLSGNYSGPSGVNGPCTATRKPAVPSLPPLADYLAKNSEPLDLGNGGRRFDAGLIDTSGKQIFFLGEAHGIAINDDLDLALLQYLHKTAGVRVYLAEWGYAAGCLMNRYVETGDERLLDFLMRESRGSISWTKEHRAFVVKFRDWNRSLPEHERVRFVGVDIEHQTRIAAWYLALLANNAIRDGHAVPASIRDSIAGLTRLDTENAAESGVKKLSDDLTASLSRHRHDYASWLGDRLLDFDVTATNLRKRYECYAGKQSNRFDALREPVIYDTFLKLQTRLAGVKCYGRWGAAHVAQRHNEGRDSFAARLNGPDSPVAGKIVTIFPLHLNVEALFMIGKGEYRSRTFSDDSALTKPLAEAARSPVTLFKLTGAGSPFAKALYPFKAGDGAVTTDYAQYFALIRDAKPTHAMEEPAQAHGARPFVVKTEPAAETQDVPPGVVEIKVTFSGQMSEKGFAFVRSMAGQHPEFLGPPVLESDRCTFTIKAKVQPGKVYATWLNTARSHSFESAEGEPAVPYLLVFKTSDR